MNGAVIAFHARHADTSHVLVTRNLWIAHLNICTHCCIAANKDWFRLCEQGQVLYDEYITAIKNHPDKEEVEL